MVREPSDRDKRRLPAARLEQVRAEEIRLLYANAGPGAIASASAVVLLAVFEWAAVNRISAIGWVCYMVLVAIARYFLALKYRHAKTGGSETIPWGTAFSAGCAAAGIGWGAAGILLFPANQLAGQLFLAFVLGGIMLGAGSLLASRPEAFLPFLLPTGLPAAVWFMLQKDELHVAMGLLAAVYTAIITFTTWNNHRTLSYSLQLRFENEELMMDLRAARDHAESVNRELERRVADRTEELRASNEKLKEEAAHRIRMEDELLRAQKLESLGVLAGGIAHDFNNFLTIVRGSLELAGTRLRQGRAVYDVLEVMESACDRAASLATKLLTFGKGGAPVRRAASLAGLLAEAATLARAASAVRVGVHAPAGLWAADIDSSQIGDALHNILLNARQAMKDRGYIEVRAENFLNLTGEIPLEGEKFLRISVRDTGGGIAPENLPRIFDPYFTTKPNATGIGLAAAYAIVRKHAGMIAVDSKLGEGTTFTIYLPATDQLPVPVPTAPEVREHAAGSILVMDDEEPIRKVVSSILEHLGYRVECARDGDEALARYRAALESGQRFSAVLMDLTIPSGMGGLEAAEQLRKLDPSAMLVVSSGYSNAPVMSEFRQHGFDAVLPKPWTVGQLSSLLQQLLKGG